MPEIITFATPIAADPGATVFRIAKYIFDWEFGVIFLYLGAWANGKFVSNGKRITVDYDGAIAVTLMRQMNKANFSTPGNSMHQTIIDRLIADGKIPAATKSGTPD